MNKSKTKVNGITVNNNPNGFGSVDACWNINCPNYEDNFKINIKFAVPNNCWKYLNVNQCYNVCLNKRL